MPASFNILSMVRADSFLKIGCIAGKPAIAIYQHIESRIIERSRHVVQRVTVQRVRERREFPRAHMRCKEKYAFAAALPLQKIFLTVENNDVFDIFPCVARHHGKFRRHPAEASNHSANCCRALHVGPLRERQLQIEFRRLAQLRGKREQGLRNSHSQPSRQLTRQYTRQFQNNPYNRVRQPFLHR